MSAEQKSPKQPGVRTVVGIDFYRGAFSLMVLIGHSIAMTLAFCQVSTEGSFFLEAVSNTLARGGIWVAGFFVLSGYCIHISIARDHELGRFKLTTYLKLRASRIYPVFLFAALLAIFVSWGHPYRDELAAGESFGLGSIASTIFMVQGFTERLSFYGPSWSLTNEFYYYLIYPLFLLVAGWRFKRAVVLCLGFNFVVSLVFVVMWKSGNEEARWMIPFWNISASSSLWLLGVLLALEWNRLANIRLLNRPTLAMVSLCLLYVAYGIHNSYLDSGLTRLLFSMIASVVFAILIIASVNVALFENPRFRRFASFIGLMSYPLYLLHAPIHGLITRCLSKDWCVQYPVVFFLLALLVPLLITATIGVKFESMVLAWRRAKLRG